MRMVFNLPLPPKIGEYSLYRHAWFIWYRGLNQDFVFYVGALPTKLQPIFQALHVNQTFFLKMSWGGGSLVVKIDQVQTSASRFLLLIFPKNKKVVTQKMVTHHVSAFHYGK